MITDMILIDLQKAFDTIDYDVLLQNLYATGSSKHTVNCFKSYLSNRSFLINVGSYFLNLHMYTVVYHKFLFRATFFKKCVDDTSQAVKYHLFLYVNDLCIVSQHKGINAFLLFFLYSSPKERISRIMKNGF